ncbi:MAG: hypothetical protein MSS84_04050 [Bacteroidales bacterium]|nr:hypothetical protein [Bacteroidales bacterium]
MKKITFLMAALLCGAVVANAQEDMRTVVTEVTVTNFVTPEYGDNCNSSNTVNKLQLPADAPYNFPNSMGRFFKKNNDDTWSLLSDGDIFAEGTYYFWAQLRVDGTYGTTHRLPSTAAELTVTVNGEPWSVDGKPTVDPTYSYAWVKSPEFTIVKKTLPLTFNDSKKLDYTENFVNTPVAEKDLKEYVVGGTETYTFSKTTSNCSWLQVSSDGIISGTPTALDKNTYHDTIQVSDGESTQKIEIYIGCVYPQSGDRTVLTTATFTGLITPVYGAALPNISLIASEGAVYSLGSLRKWQKKADDDSWAYYSGAQFEVGTYRAQVQLRIDGSNGYYHVLSADTKMEVDGQEWTILGGVSVFSSYSCGIWVSPEFEVKATSTGVDRVQTPAIYAHQGRIYGAEGACIYDLLGRDVTRLNGSLHGVYVVKTANAAQKVIVK